MDKNSPKRLSVYLKTPNKMHNLETKVKKAGNTICKSLHVSVDGVCDEYVGLVGEMLYTLRVMLPSLTAQTEAATGGVI